MEFIETIFDSKLYSKLPFRMKKRVTNLLMFGLTAKEAFMAFTRSLSRNNITAIVGENKEVPWIEE